SLMFGLGMALVGTCGFGSLVRLGGGDLRAFVVILTFAAAAYAMLRGALAPFRIGVIEQVSTPMPGGHPAGIVEVAEGLTGWPLRALLAFGLAAALILAVVADRRLWKAPRLLAAGLALGLGVTAGWVATGVLADDFTPVRVQSLTFVAPVARGVFSLVLGGADWFDFGAMSVAGVILGAGLAALAADEFRWEAFDDHYEMRRHLAGAILMGAGGVLAGGCTIGQGITAGSLLAVSWPIAALGILIGARIGIAILVEGSPRLWLADVWRRMTQRDTARP
ncbi:MAG: YeeE/YedE family protein, partial [Beijerinckiaceae bacterium]